MKKLLCIALIFFALAPVAFAQQDTTAMPKWEVGLDLLWLVDKNTLPATSIFIRKHTANKAGKSRAYRMRLGLDTDFYKDFTLDTFPENITGIAPYTRLGYEWQKNLAPKYAIYYGFDLHVLYSHKERVAKRGIPGFGNDTYDIYERWRTLQTGVVPFIGFKYQLNRFVYVGAEATLGVVKNDYRAYTRVNTLDGKLVQTGNRKISRVNTSFIPITVLNFGFIIK